MNDATKGPSPAMRELNEMFGSPKHTPAFPDGDGQKSELPPPCPPVPCVECPMDCEDAGVKTSAKEPGRIEEPPVAELLDISALIRRAETAVNTIGAAIRLERERQRLLAHERATRMAIIDNLDLKGAEDRLLADLAALGRAQQEDCKVRRDCGEALAGLLAQRIAGDVQAEVEIEFSITAEERKAQKLPNNEAVRRQEYERRLTLNEDYQAALRDQRKARERLADAEADRAMAEAQYRVTRDMLHSRISQLEFLAH